MMDILYVVLLIGGLIFVHELGHFLVARWVGVHVVEFSIGFGPRITSFRGKQIHPNLPPTEFTIAMLPVGGFVKMLGADPTEQVPAEVRAVALEGKPIWARFLIAAAGPAFNLILPLILFFVVGLVTTDQLPASAGNVSPNGPAWNAGIRSGDVITSVDGQAVRYWFEMVDEVESRPDETVPITYQRGDRTLSSEIALIGQDVPVIPRSSLTRRVGKMGVGLSLMVPIIGVQPGSVAETAGLRDGDLIVTRDGVHVKYLHQALAALQGTPGAIELGVVRYQDTPTSGLRFGVGEALKITLPAAGSGADPLRGVISGECVVANVMPGSPADAVGIRPGDRLVRFDTLACDPWIFSGAYLGGRGTEPVQVVTRRAGVERTVTLTQVEVPWPLDLQPDRTQLIHGLRTLYSLAPMTPIAVEGQPGFALSYAFERTGNAIYTTLAVLGGLLTGQVSIGEGMGGPMLMGALAVRAAEDGPTSFLRLMALLSVSLGLINLLPIPVLDGGQILFLALEGIRRKPVSMRARMIATYIGLAFIVILMVVVLRNDLNRCSGAAAMIGL